MFFLGIFVYDYVPGQKKVFSFSDNSVGITEESFFEGRCCPVCHDYAIS